MLSEGHSRISTPVFFPVQYAVSKAPRVPTNPEKPHLFSLGSVPPEKMVDPTGFPHSLGILRSGGGGTLLTAIIWDKMAAGREDIGIVMAQRQLTRGFLGGK